MAQDNSYECSEGQNRADCQNVINEGGVLLVGNVAGQSVIDWLKRRKLHLIGDFQ